MKLSKLALLLALAMVLSVLGGCAQPAAEAEAPPSAEAPQEEAPASDVPESQEPVPEEEPSPSEPIEEEAPRPVISYPIEGDYEFTYFFPGSRGRGFKNPGEDCLVHQQMVDITGVNVTYISPAADAATEQYNLLLASGEYTDMVTGGTPTNGYDSAIEEDIFIRLNELMEENAPDYWALLNADQAVYKAAATDSGHQYGFMMLYDQPGGTLFGLVCRGDWLEELGMEVPNTIDQFTAMLEAFYTNYNCSDTWYMDSTLFPAGAAVSGAYGVTNSGMVKNETEYIYAALEPGYKDYVDLMRSYYEAGYISSDFTTISRAIPPNTNIVFNNQAGVFSEFYNSVTSNVNQASSLIPGYDLLAVPKLWLDEDTPPNYKDLSLSFSSLEHTAITTACEYPEIACQWLNYFYTEPGILLTNYGVEGVSFNYGDNGSYEFTDLMLNNPDGKNFTTCLEEFCMYTGTMYRIFDRDMTACEEYDREAYQVWNRDDYEAEYTAAPSTISLTTEESEAVSSKSTDISTYLSEMLPKFVTGEIPMDQWDTMIAEIHNLGVEDVIAAYQAALDRYNNR